MSEINNEELAAFVTSTLNAISTGVSNAAESGNMRFDLPKEVEFEVAVTATKAKEGGGGLRIQVFSAEGKLSAENEHVSRIRFAVGKVNINMAGSLRTGMRKGVV